MTSTRSGTLVVRTVSSCLEVSDDVGMEDRGLDTKNCGKGGY